MGSPRRRAGGAAVVAAVCVFATGNATNGSVSQAAVTSTSAPGTTPPAAIESTSTTAADPPLDATPTSVADTPAGTTVDATSTTAPPTTLDTTSSTVHDTTVVAGGESGSVIQSAADQPLLSPLGADIISGNRGGCGTSISMSADGQVLGVGAPFPPTDEPGAVRVFRWTGSDWAQLGEPITVASRDEVVGTTVALSADGRRVAVAGSSVRVHQWTEPGVWQQLGGDVPGYPDVTAIALSAGGDRIAVGRFGGVVAVYDWAEGADAWRQVGDDILPPGWERGFSPYVAFSSRGDRLAIGAGLSDPEFPYRPGTPMALLYELTEPSASWVQVGPPLPVDGFSGPGGTAGGNAGVRVALSGGGTRLVLGTPGYDLVEFALRGGWRAFDFDEFTASWTRAGERFSDDRLDAFGSSVSLAANGGRMAIGGPPMRIYDWDGASDGWRQIGSDLPSVDDVALSADGTRLAIDLCGSNPVVRVLGIATSSPAVDRPSPVLPETGTDTRWLGLAGLLLALGTVSLLVSVGRSSHP